MECVLDASKIEERLEQLELNYSPRQINFILGELSHEEMQVIDDTSLGTSDYLPIALANWMVREHPELAKRFDTYKILDQKHYMQVQRKWLEEELFLLGKRLGHAPTPHDLVEDFTNNNNGSRHRVYYCLRHPMKVEKPKQPALV